LTHLGQEIVNNAEKPELLVFRVDKATTATKKKTQRVISFKNATTTTIYSQLAFVVTLFKRYLMENRSFARNWLWY
jgi:hypothetical protein